MVLVSEESHAVYAQAAGRLAHRLGVEVTRTPGTHTAYHDHPYELAQTIRPFLRRCAASGGDRGTAPAGSPRSHNEAFRITDGNIAAGNQATPSRRSDSLPER
jgi:hypothetical protein